MLMFLFQEENILDVLQLVLSIMTEKPEAAVPALDRVDGLRCESKMKHALLKQYY